MNVQFFRNVWGPRFYPCKAERLQTEYNDVLHPYPPRRSGGYEWVPCCQGTSSHSPPCAPLVQSSSALFGRMPAPAFHRAAQNTHRRRRTHTGRREPCVMGMRTQMVKPTAARAASLHGGTVADTGSSTGTCASHVDNNRLLTLEDVRRSAKDR